MSRFEFARLLSPFRKALLAAIVPVGLLGFAGPGQADVIADVNTRLFNIIQNTSPSLIDGPPEVAREIAMVNGAMFDAVNASSGGNFSPLYYSGGAVSGASADAAALKAAYTVMSYLYGAGSLYAQYAGVTGAQYYGSGSPYAGTIVGPTNPQCLQVMAEVNAIQTQLNSLGSSSATTTGASVGTAAATAMINGRASDNGQAAMLSTLSYTAPSGSGTVAGVYVPPVNRPALEPTAGAVTPFVINATQQAALTNATPSPSVLTSSIYANQVLQTECLGSSGALGAGALAACQASPWKPQTAAEAQAALYWNDPGGTFQPPGHWLQIADQVADPTHQNLGLLAHSMLDALVGAAMSDAGAAAWQLKFNGNGNVDFTGERWRPITAIRDCANWNATFSAANACDASWNSLIATPPHPDYIAGHPAFSGAAATVLDNFFQNDNLAFAVSSQAYCNAGSTQRAADGTVISCTTDRAYLVSNPSDCNNAGTGDQAPLNADYTVNTSYNKSPLICSTIMSFTGFQAASSGDLGSTLSRVVGGIHTPEAVDSALALGNAIGQAVSNQADLPEPASIAILTLGLITVGMARHHLPRVRACAGRRGALTLWGGGHEFFGVGDCVFIKNLAGHAVGSRE